MTKEVQPNLRKKAVLVSNSDFNMNLKIDEPAKLLIEGYALRLTKKGKELFPKLSTGNLSESEEATIRMMCESTGASFSGKGGAVYQVTVFTNLETEETFVNTFNPNEEAGESIDVICVQQKDKDGHGITYGTDNLPSLTLKITNTTKDSANANLEQPPVIKVKKVKNNLAQPPVIEE